MEILYAKLQAASMFFLDGTTYFLIAMIGAFVKDIYDTVSGTIPKIEIRRIFVSTTLSTFLIFAARGYLNSDLEIAITFILGVIGWELFSRICTINGLKRTLISLRNLHSTLTKEHTKPEEKQNEEKKIEIQKRR